MKHLTVFVFLLLSLLRFSFSQSCGGSFNDTATVTGFIYGPNSGGFYPPNSNCNWTFTCVSGSAGVSIYFPSIFVENGYDFINLYSNGALYNSYTGTIAGTTNVPGSVVSVVFTSDDIVEFAAFNFTYTFIGASPSRTPSVSPSRFATSSTTPSPSSSPSATPSVSPSVTPSVTRTPSPTPSVTPSTYCGSTVFGSINGTIQIPSTSDGNYQPNTLCTWTFPAIANYPSLIIEFSNTTLEPNEDFLFLYQGDSTTPFTLTGTVDNIRIETGPPVTVVFRSDFNIEYPAFQFTFQYINPASSPSSTPSAIPSAAPSSSSSPSSVSSPSTPSVTPTPSTTTPSSSPTPAAASQAPSVVPTPSATPPTLCGCSVSDSTNGTINIPLTSDGSYQPNTKCTWTFPSKSGFELLRLKFSNITLGNNDLLFLYQGSSTNPFTLSGTVDYLLVSMEPSVTVVFWSDFDLEYPAFQFAFQYVNSNDDSSTTDGIVSRSTILMPSLTALLAMLSLVL